MRLSGILAAFWLGCSQAAAFAVFAHFMVGNTLKYGYSDWEADIVAARQAGIDAFALNIARDEPANFEIDQAFEVAVAQGFKLFFSFDYAGLGYWEKEKVKSLINKWKSSPAYYYHSGKPLVSTFEGPGAASEWPEIKAATGCFFVPDWSSLGAKRAALEVGNGIIDGLFSWAAWPWGNTDMNTHGDASYMQFLQQGGKPTYMIPVSPLFYTNLPFWNKNWLWRGDDLWFDRWIQVLYLTRIQKDFAPPTFAQIISWNDFGESHYIGPLVSKALYAFDTGKAPFRYADGVPHDGFRKFLPFLIQLSKTGAATVGTQGVVMWYRNSAALACTYSGTVGNTATQLQREFSPAGIVADKVFYSALLGAPAAVTVTVGGVSLNAAWTDTPPGGVGLYHGSASFAGRSGQVVVTVNGIATVVGSMPISACTQQNFNPYVYSASGPSSSASLNINGQVCIAGFGVGDFANICKFSCALGYCPVTACTCSRIGPQPTRPTALQKDGYPTNGDRNFEGLCSFAVNYRYTGSECSQNKPASWFVPALSPFFPDTATSGIGNRAHYDGMCVFSCRHGWCPINLCTPKSYGPLVDVPGWNPQIGTFRTTLSTTEFLLCRFTSTYGYANKDFCFEPPPPPPQTTTPTLPEPTPSPAPSPTPSPTPPGYFMVYIGQEFMEAGLGGSGSGVYDMLWLMSAEPACPPGGFPSNASPHLLNPNDDVSQDGGWACDGCKANQERGNWDITRLEMWDEPNPKDWDMYGVTKGHVGYLTAYQQPDKTYVLVSTLTLGGTFIQQGTCTRAPYNSDDFDCKDPKLISTTTRYGKHVLTCVGNLSPNV